MFSFLESIADFFVQVTAFLFNFLRSVFDMFKWIGKGLQYIGNLLPYLPQGLAAIAAVFVTVSVVYLIVGR